MMKNKLKSGLICSTNSLKTNWLELFTTLETNYKICFSDDDKVTIKELALSRRPLDNKFPDDDFLISHRDFGAYICDMDHNLEVIRELVIVQNRQNRIKFVLSEN
jgi:hypothetical protein